MRKRSASKTRSELECFVLGLVWDLGPCSPYLLRVHLARSPSSQWSASAGAIYPLVARLERQGLLSSRARTTGRRGHRELRITRQGVTVLRRWIGPPLAPGAVTVSYDPLRSRARFLGILTAAERRAWVEAALDTLDEVAARVRAWHDAFAGDDQFAASLTQSGEIDIAGRRRWLKSGLLAGGPVSTVARATRTTRANLPRGR